MTATRDKEPIASCVLQPLASQLGLSEVPATISKANVEIFNSVSIEITSFLIFYADKWEKGLIKNQAALFREWQELTASYLEQRYLYKQVNEVFYHKILTKKRVEFRERRGHYLKRQSKRHEPVG